MASIWRHPNSPFWSGCFNVYVGSAYRQRKLSLGTSDRKLARRLADEIESAVQGKLSAEEFRVFLGTIGDLSVRRVAHRIADRLLREASGVGLTTKTVRGFVADWLAKVGPTVASPTLQRYESTATRFIEALGGKADGDLALVRQDDIARFRDAEARRTSPASANVSLKIIRILLGAAEADGALPRNEARHVKTIRVRAVMSKRRAFTVEELRRILEACDAEWRSMVILGLYTGARISDVATFTWENVDLTRGEIRYVSRKTGRTTILPMAAALREHVEGLRASDNPRDPIHPRAFATVTKENRVGTLSRQFGEILAAAGLAAPRTHKALPDGAGKGRAGRRNVSEVSYHCLRHTLTSWLKNAGVSDAIARDLVGHESAEISRLYTHVDDAAKRDALNRVPSL